MFRQLMVIAMVAGVSAPSVHSHALAQNSQGLQLGTGGSVTAAPRQTGPRRGHSTLIAPGTSAVGLTSGECRGLGGTVEADNNVCNAKGQSACKTVDRDGVVRVLCIDEVKN